MLRYFLIAVFVFSAVFSSMAEEGMDQYVGKMTYSAAVKKWGKPDSKKKLKNGEVVARWVRIEHYPMPVYDTTYYTRVPTWQQDMLRYETTSELTLRFNRKGILSDWGRKEQP